jgi:hypothetical protein
MNGQQEEQHLGLIDRLLGRLGLRGGGIEVLENSTEELVEATQKGKEQIVYSMPGTTAPGAMRKRKLQRKEENYLWSTRRFPNNTANNTIGGGTLTTDDFPYFGNGVGDTGQAMGYASISNLGFMQTNMDKGGRVPTGRGFAMHELAISFNALARPHDIAAFMDVAELRFEKNNGDFTLHHGPARLWPGGTGVGGFAAVLNATGGPGSQVFGHNGMASLAAVRRFKQPRLLNANESFTYVMHTNANFPNDNTPVVLSAFLDVCIWLYGYHFIRQTS